MVFLLLERDKISDVFISLPLFWAVSEIGFYLSLMIIYPEH